MGAGYPHFCRPLSTKAKDIFFPVATKPKSGGICLNNFWESDTKNSNKITPDAGIEQKGEPKSHNSWIYPWDLPFAGATVEGLIFTQCEAGLTVLV